MAKDKAKKEKAAAKSKKKKAPPPLEKPDWGIDQLAKHLKIETSVARQRLRAAGVKKDGRTYDFGSKAGMEKVAKQIDTKKAA